MVGIVEAGWLRRRKGDAGRGIGTGPDAECEDAGAVRAARASDSADQATGGRGAALDRAGTEPDVQQAGTSLDSARAAAQGLAAEGVVPRPPRAAARRSARLPP